MINYLRYFTWLTRFEIDELEQKLIERPERREAQRTLAREVTRMVHDETALTRAELASQVLFGGEIADLGADEIQDIFADVPSSEIKRSALEGDGITVVDLLSDSGVTRSKGEARRLIENRGAYVNNRRVVDAEETVALDATIDGRFIVLRSGKKRYHLVRVR